MMDQLLRGGDDLDWRKPILGSVGGGRQGAGTSWQWQLVHKVCIRTSANLKQCNPWLIPHLQMVDPLVDGWPTGWLTHSPTTVFDAKDSAKRDYEPSQSNSCGNLFAPRHQKSALLCENSRSNKCVFCPPEESTLKISLVRGRVFVPDSFWLVRRSEGGGWWWCWATSEKERHSKIMVVGNISMMVGNLWEDQDAGQHLHDGGQHIHDIGQPLRRSRCRATSPWWWATSCRDLFELCFLFSSYSCKKSSPPLSPLLTLIILLLNQLLRETGSLGVEMLKKFDTYSKL